jgi:sn-glycerol 3-phosphate transport system ATP-binding protein
MTVAENLAYPLKIARLPKPERQTRIEEAARILGLSELLDRRPAQLSGGQRQRVAMGRAIVRKPDVFLFDEPLSNLDAKLRVQMRLEIKRLHRQLGATSVFVTHDQVEAMTMADLLIVMNGGRIEQIGSPAEVYAHPATTFAASFIGSPAMSLFPVRIADGVGHLTGAEDHRIDLPGVRASGDTILGLRSEDVSLSPATGKVQVRIELIEDFGAARLAHCRMPSGDSVAATLPKSTTLREDMLAWLDWPAEALHLFDPLNGRRTDRTGMATSNVGPEFVS